jgi:NhaA family Na+:H+ antiporter
MYRVSPHIVQFAWALGAGLVLATLWVNLDPASYYDVIEYRLWAPHLPSVLALTKPIFSLQFITSQGLMALFIGLIAKELWEALVLSHGALSGRHRRIMPLGAVLGGALGAVGVWLAIPNTAASPYDLGSMSGWSLPIGSDVILCYVFGTWVFGKGHPALHLLLLIAIAFDILGLLGIAVTSLSQWVQPLWLGLSVLALVAIWRFSSRHAHPNASEIAHRRAALLWPYALAGFVCWLGFVLSGLPGALGLLPLIPLIPHAERSFGLFAEAEDILHDPLNRLAHLLARPVTVTLFLFGLTNGSVDLQSFGALTPQILTALWLGKPLGILAGAWIGLRLSARPMPKGVSAFDLGLIAILLGMGMTVPLLALDTALPAGLPADQVRAGLAASLGFGLLALVLARLFGPKRAQG